MKYDIYEIEYESYMTNEYDPYMFHIWCLIYVHIWINYIPLKKKSYMLHISYIYVIYIRYICIYAAYILVYVKGWVLYMIPICEKLPYMLHVCIKICIYEEANSYMLQRRCSHLCVIFHICASSAYMQRLCTARKIGARFQNRV